MLATDRCWPFVAPLAVVRTVDEMGGELLHALERRDA